MALLEQCFEGTLPGGLNNSEKNDVTNIGKASDLYLLSDKAPLLSIPVYVEGIGTAKGQDDTKAGAGADKGETSSTSRVEQACRTQIVAKIKEQLSEILPSIECIHKVEFDVFGFSRGPQPPASLSTASTRRGTTPWWRR